MYPGSRDVVNAQGGSTSNTINLEVQSTFCPPLHSIARSTRTFHCTGSTMHRPWCIMSYIQPIYETYVACLTVRNQWHLDVQQDI